MDKLQEIKETLGTIRDEWVVFKFPSGGYELFEKESRAIILQTYPTDSNGRFDGSIIAKFPEYITYLLQVVEEQKKLIDRIHQQVQWGDQVQTNWKVNKWIEEMFGKE